MVEYDLITYIEADSALDTLLSSTGSDTKIYPSKPPTGVTLPYILYFWGVGDQGDEMLDEDRIQLTARAEERTEATNIRDRLKVLLDKQDRIQDVTFATASTTYHVYYCRFTGGDGFWEPETEVWNSVLFFNIKYRKKD